MNQLIRMIETLGLTNAVYWFFMLLGAVFVLLLVLRLRNRYGLSVKQVILEILLTYSIGFLWVTVAAWIESGFSDFGARDIGRAFVFVPLIALIPARMLHIKKEILWELDAPSLALLQGVSHFGCMFAGCCYGYPSTWGLWNIVYNKTLFPIQPLESMVSLGIFVICMRYIKRTGYRGSGKVYPLFLVLFGFTRFFLEFLRDNSKVFGNVSDLALHAALMFFVGLLWLCYIWDKEARTRKHKKLK